MNASYPVATAQILKAEEIKAEIEFNLFVIKCLLTRMAEVFGMIAVFFSIQFKTR